MDQLREIAKHFKIEGKITSIHAFGSGNVNDTYLVFTTSENNKQIILQRINQKVFARPELISQNMFIITEHVRRKLKGERQNVGRRWELPSVLLTQANLNHLIDSRGDFWRAMSFIENTKNFVTIQNLGQAEEVGFVLGKFQKLVNDIPLAKLHDTLPGFHVTPLYLQRFQEIYDRTTLRNMSSDEKYCVEFISAHRGISSVLEDAKKKKRIPLRPVHGDPKISNILFDARTGHGVSIVDLDTVGPGLTLYDIGDCLRSCCNATGEDIDTTDDIYFDAELCRALLRGYFREAKSFLTKADYAYIFDAVRLITFELGMRFFTDYLEGNVYFKVKNESHNLFRALIQFRLTASIESQERDISLIVNDLQKQHIS